VNRLVDPLVTAAWLDAKSALTIVGVYIVVTDAGISRQHSANQNYNQARVGQCAQPPPGRPIEIPCGTKTIKAANTIRSSWRRPVCGSATGRIVTRSAAAMRPTQAMRSGWRPRVTPAVPRGPIYWRRRRR
jgi:hypothetical protein